MDSSGDCSYTTNGASPPQAQMTSADRKAAEAKAAETLQIRYYDPNNQRKSKFKRHLTSGGVFYFKQAMLRTVHMAGKHYGGVNDTPPPYTPPNSDWYAAPQDYKELHTPQRE